MKILFFGTPDFAVPFLTALFDDRTIEVQAVVCQPDKPVGRSQALTPPAVKITALDRHLPILQPANLKSDAVIEMLSEFSADLFVVVAYGKILPQEVLDLPRLGVINVHPSLLPKYRGPSPMQWAIREGDTETGVTIMLLDAGMDTGPVLAQKRIPLDIKETYETLQTKVHEIGPRLLVDTIMKFASGHIKPQPQEDTETTITKLLSREDGQIDWRRSAQEIDRQIRAYNPWPGAWTMLNGKRLKILKAHIMDESAHNDGTYNEHGSVILARDEAAIACGNGYLAPDIVQLEGKHKQAIDGFVKGHKLFIGSRLCVE